MITRKHNRNIKSSRFERFQKSRKMESVSDDSHNAGEVFDTGEQPNAERLIEDLIWL